MKYILIKGARSAGKSHTISEVSRRLKPDVVRKVYYQESGRAFVEQITSNADLSEGTFIITVRNKNILMVAGSPTEQRRRITAIIQTVMNMNLKPDFAIIAMRGLEKLKDFATASEMEKFGKCIYETKIWRIPSNSFNLTAEWNKRISYLTAITLHNI